MPNDQYPTERPAKRPKTRLACQECRERKIRCDGARPVCDSCTKKKLGPKQCVYADGTGSNAQYVQELERRIRELEESRSQNRPSNSAEPNGEFPPPLAMNTVQGVSPSAPFYGMNIFEEEDQIRERRDLSIDARPIDPQLAQLSAESMAHFSQPFAFNQSVQRPSTPRYQSESHSTQRPPSGNIVQNDGEESNNPTVAIASTMGTTEEIPSDDGRVVYLGRSSAAAFMKEVSQANPKKRTPSDMGAAHSPSTSRASQTRSKKEREQLYSLMESIVLPPRKIADTYLGHYWEYVYPLMPIFHKPSFMLKYNRVWHGDMTGSLMGDKEDSIHTVRAFYSILNAVFALGCTFIPDTAQHNRKTAETFFQRSQELIVVESYNHGCMGLVQALILGAQYLQSSNYINRCWVTIGCAIRVAQGIGIQLDLPAESQAEREERRRTWWCCVLMDRVHSMTFGRPPMVGWPSVVPYPSIVNDEDLSMEPGSSARHINPQDMAITAAFVNTLKLSEILMDVLKTFYAFPAAEHMPLPEQFTHVQLIDNRLGRWSEELPGFLQWKEGHSEQRIVYIRQAITLRCRFLHLQILCFRPTTVSLARSRALKMAMNGEQTMFQQSMSQGCVSSCVVAAQELIHVIYQEKGKGTLPPWWYSVFYLYTAGTVILATILTPTLRTTSDKLPESLETSWQTCLQCLCDMRKNDNAFANRCLLLLTTARDQFLRDATEGRASQDAPQQTVTMPVDADVRQSSFADIANAYEDMLNEEAFVDHWWPVNGLDWLNSLPVDATAL